MQLLSFYILTYNSEKYIGDILDKINKIADEIIVVDSKSSDSTKEIVSRYAHKYYLKDFKNYAQQHLYAIDKCTNKWIFTLDSDEIPTDDLITSIDNLKKSDFNESLGIDAYRITRYWHVLNKAVHSIYPNASPDTPVRLFLKTKATYSCSSLVHETIAGFKNISLIKVGHVQHYTFESDTEMKDKLQRYTDLAALDAKRNGKHSSVLHAFGHAIFAFIKFYFIKSAYKDGLLGCITAKYAFDYTWSKYIKLIKLHKDVAARWDIS
jgi:glycosyltransferase involved in cell wall biosynthesis